MAILNKAHYADRQIDGKAFSQLTREDFVMIFPSKDKFLLASILYKLSQQIRQCDLESSRSTPSLLEELSDLASSTPGSSRSSTPFSSRKRTLRSQLPASKRTHTDEYRLPHFPPDIKRCIKNDAFYSVAQRNKLIKEGCRALRGHCWGDDRTVTNEEKKKLSRMLFELAPKSLGDPDNPI